MDKKSNHESFHSYVLHFPYQCLGGKTFQGKCFIQFSNSYWNIKIKRNKRPMVCGDRVEMWLSWFSKISLPTVFGWFLDHFPNQCSNQFLMTNKKTKCKHTCTFSTKTILTSLFLPGLQLLYLMWYWFSFFKCRNDQVKKYDWKLESWWQWCIII